MTTYGYIRTSKGHDPDRPGMNPETQRRDLINAGVPERNIHSDIDVSGYAGVATRSAWRSLDPKLKRGDTLVLSALDRLGRRSLDVMVVHLRPSEPRSPASKPRGQRALGEGS